MLFKTDVMTHHRLTCSLKTWF